MKHFVFSLLMVIAGAHTINAQHLSVDLKLNNPVFPARSFEQSIDLSNFVLEDFVAISIVFEGENVNANTLLCKLESKAGWQDIPPFTEEETPGRFVSELVFVPVKDALILVVQVDFDPDLDLTGIQGRVHVFSPTGSASGKEQPVDNSENLAASACPCPPPAFVPRTSWGSAYELTGDIYTPPAIYTTVTHLIVHHSAGSNSSNNWPSVVAAIFDYHVHSNGWADIGYNWLIAPNGLLFEGRGGGDNVRGSHMCGYNNNTMGVCVLGNYVDVPLPSAGMETLKNLLSWKSCEENITPDGSGSITSYSGYMKHISGHRDGCPPGYTECPGGMIYAQLAALRLSVGYEIQNGCFTSVASFSPVLLPVAFSANPNPVIDMLQLRFATPQNVTTIHLMDALGQVVGDYCVEAGSSALTIPVGYLASGLYYVLSENSGKVEVLKFIKI